MARAELGGVEETMDKRQLGNTGEMLSVIGFGGIMLRDTDPAEASRLVSRAVNGRGVNYFDVAPSYGNAEEMLGPALEPYRDGVFLACKTGERSAGGAERELAESLERLRTDHFDLYQLHAVSAMDEVEQITAPGGALEAFIRAREQGKVRYLGFSAHSEEAALELVERFDFDTVLFPFNWVTWYEGNFGHRLLARAQEKGMGVLAIKALAKRALAEGEPRKRPNCWYYPVESYEEARLAVRFTLSKPVTSAVTPGDPELFEWACDAAEEFEPLSEAEEKELASRARGLQPVFPH